jgi:hypothetical protein
MAKAPLCGAFAEPSDGLEPSPPLLTMLSRPQMVATAGKRFGFPIHARDATYLTRQQRWIDPVLPWTCGGESPTELLLAWVLRPHMGRR